MRRGLRRGRRSSGSPTRERALNLNGPKQASFASRPSRGRVGLPRPSAPGRATGRRSGTRESFRCPRNLNSHEFSYGQGRPPSPGRSRDCGILRHLLNPLAILCSVESSWAVSLTGGRSSGPPEHIANPLNSEGKYTRPGRLDWSPGRTELCTRFGGGRRLATFSNLEFCLV
jgi:hypothetical protein